MKKLILNSAIVLISLTTFAQNGPHNKKWYIGEDQPSGGGYSQNLRFSVHGKYKRAIKKENLNDAKVISDFIPDYPVNWITNYVSVEIMTTSNGKAKKAVSANDALSTEQKNILNTVDPGTEIVINVAYKYENPATNKMYNHTMNVSMMVVPETEAEYIGGYQQLKKYLKENAIDKISEITSTQFQFGEVTFTVNEKGEIVNAKISQTSGDSKTDKLLIDAIHKMPKWKPADSKGVKVKQQFVFSVGIDGC